VSNADLERGPAGPPRRSALRLSTGERLTGRQESVSLRRLRLDVTWENGSEHSGSRGFADTEGVTGSNPVAPTGKALTSGNAVALTTMALSNGNAGQLAVRAGSRGGVPDGERFPCLTFLFMDPPGPDPLLRSFERHLYAENRSARTVTTYLIALSHRRPAGLRLPARPRTSPEAATRADLEAFLADLLARRKASTAGANQKVLKIFYGWLAEERRFRPTRSCPPTRHPQGRTSWCPRGGLEPPVSGFAHRCSVPEL
jgi:hypothetical protein